MAISQTLRSNNYDVAVIGGGPAGMMVAGRASELGSRVVLLEKNQKLGIKLLSTGGGRCNLCNDLPETREFINRIGRNGKFLFSSINIFGAPETMAFFESRGVPLKTEFNGKVFPMSNKATDVLQAMINYMKEGGVDVLYNSEVVDIWVADDMIMEVLLSDGRKIRADKYVVCVGGKSYPQTGSDGELFDILSKLGHHIVPLKPTLTPLVLEESFIKEIEGISLSGLRVVVLRGEKKLYQALGDIMFTSNGISGPVILDASRTAEAGDKISLDFFANTPSEELYADLMDRFRGDGKRMIKNILETDLPTRFVSTLLRQVDLDSEAKSSTIKKDDCKRLVKTLKDFRLSITSLAGFDRAMVTAGGVDLAEVEPRTMQSKLINNLYIAGESLDLDGPTGGFNLQICWTTGFAAGEAVCQ